jgi:hypothetical protein
MRNLGSARPGAIAVCCLAVFAGPARTAADVGSCPERLGRAWRLVLVFADHRLAGPVDGDIQLIGEVVLRMRFYASPVLYVATLVPGEWLRIYLCNSILTDMRHVMMDPHAAGAAEAIGGAEWLPIPLGIIAFVFAPGLLRLPSRGAAGRENL